MTIQGDKAKKKEKKVLKKMERQKKKQQLEEKQLEFDRVLAQLLHKTQMETTKRWLEENPEVNVSALNLPGDLFPSAATVAANTITSGGATGSEASAATVAVASGHHSRAPATFEEQQSVPAAPEPFPSNFVSCPRCGGVRARWEITSRTGRPWFRCHSFPHSCSFAVFQ